MTDSGLRGRGGAAFPTGIKWKTVADAPPDQGNAQKYVTCNADEGDSGTFADRMLMEGDPFCLIEGMTIAAIAVGATQGYIYLRCEYPHAHRALNAAIEAAYAQGYLGAEHPRHGQAVRPRGPARRRRLHLRRGDLDAREPRGEARRDPPAAAAAGHQGTVRPADHRQQRDVARERARSFFRRAARSIATTAWAGRAGTLTIQLGGNIKRGGLIERAFGVTLREILYDYGGGSATGRPIRAVQVGGPLGAYLPESQFDTPLDYEAFTNIQALLGHGGIVAFDDTVDMAQMARYAMEFCAIESCGKCTPCRIGSTRGVEVMDRVISGQNRAASLALVEELCDTMLNGSLCGLGGLTPYPVQSAMRHFPDDFNRSPNREP